LGEKEDRMATTIAMIFGVLLGVIEN